MKNDYKYGDDWDADEIRADMNLSNVLKGKHKRKNRKYSKFLKSPFRKTEPIK